MNDTPKRDRRLEAQKRAAELRRQEQRRARRRQLLIGGGVVVAVLAVGGIVAAVVVNGQPSSTSASAGRTSTASASAGAWTAPADVEGAVRAAGLQMLTAEGSALHIHQHLTVTVDGAPVAVPAGIGIDEAQQRISPIHTHDESGIIHVESAEVRTFTLGQVFDEWGQKLGPGQVGAYRDGVDGQTVTVFVNGKPFTGDPRTITLTSHEDIDFVVAKKGTTASAPKAFAWPAGY
ncbi:hypothetical protein ACFRFH_04555 [Leifsonia sp. NPDC056824]|uniref:hypothetical protein n=1 Tax=Leifsonia sp. NPDC056824 TaxID=3345953 RepID=UPI0036BCC1AD